jgi:hypothetical protein
VCNNSWGLSTLPQWLESGLFQLLLSINHQVIFTPNCLLYAHPLLTSTPEIAWEKHLFPHHCGFSWYSATTPLQTNYQALQCRKDKEERVGVNKIHIE